MLRPALIVLALLGCAPNPGPGAENRLVQEIQRLDTGWMTAYDRHDQAAMRRVVDPGMRMTHASGRVTGAEEEIEAVLTPSPTELEAAWRVEPERVAAFRHAAVSVGRYVQAGTFRGQPFQRAYRYTNTYVRIRGAWKLVATQFTSVER